ESWRPPVSRWHRGTDRRTDMTIEQAAQAALDVQDACNLSGVVITFAEAMRALCESPEIEGTRARNRHPIAVLFANKVADMTGQCCDGDGYSAAYDACQTLARGDA